jgi:cytoskeletal protein RodZ
MFLQSNSFDNNNKSRLYLIIVFIVFGLAVFLIWYFSQAIQILQTAPTTGKVEKKEEVLTPKPLTQEEIADILSKTEPDKSPQKPPLSEEEIKKILQGEAAPNEKATPLSESEIQNILNQK